MQSWTEHIKQRDRDRKTRELAQRISAQNTRRANRRHMIEHPLRHAIARARGR